MLAECLASIPTALAGHDYEVLVADNASSDGSADMVQERFPGVTLIANSTNLGYAKANNDLAARVQGELLLFLNPDTVLSNIEPLLERIKADPKTVLVAPQLVYPDGRVQQSCRRFPSPAMLFQPGRYKMRDFDHKTAREVDQPMATAWLVRKEAWEDVGPFDERFPIFFNDVDWCCRAKRKGWKIWFDPATQTTHHHGGSTRQVKPAMVWESHRSLLRYYRKHHPAGLLLAPLIWIGAWVRAKGWHAGFRPDDHHR